MSAEAATKETHSEPVTPVVPIEELAFVKARLPVLQPDKGDLVASKRAGDRTTFLVRKWKLLTDELPKIRTQTMGCLEAVEGKGGAVILRVCDRQRYDALQEAIVDRQAQITAIEQAMRELDSLNAGWIDELRSNRDALAGTERKQRAMLTSWATSALQKNSNSSRTAEEILKGDEQYQNRKTKVEAQVARSKATLDDLILRLERIEEILSSCGC